MTLGFGAEEGVANEATGARQALKGPRPVGFMPGLEILRGVAAGAVVAEHTWALTTEPRFRGSAIVEGLGEWGVVLFFLISGYILCDGFWKPKPQSAGKFWVRRIFRIAPAYYVNIGLLFLFFATSSQLFSAQGAKQLAANVTFTHWLFPNTASSLNVNGALWTLTIEMCLYLALPVMAPAMRRRPWATFAALFGLGVAYRVWITFDGRWLEHLYFASNPSGSPSARLFLQRQFVGVLPLFAIGMILRWCVLRWQSRSPRAAGRLHVGVLMVLLVPSLILLEWVIRASDFRHPFFFITYEIAMVLVMAPCVVYASVWTATPGSSTVRRALIWLGERSYSLYLWHFPIILAVFGRGPETAPANMHDAQAKMVLIAVLSLVAADLSYRTIEKPGRDFGRQLSQRMTGRRPKPVEVNLSAAG